MKIIVKTLTLLCLFLMAACQKQEPAYKAKLNVKPEAMFEELHRLGMPDEETPGFSKKNFMNYFNVN